MQLNMVDGRTLSWKRHHPLTKQDRARSFNGCCKRFLQTREMLILTSAEMPRLDAHLASVLMEANTSKGELGLQFQAYTVKTRERRGSSFSQLGLEPNHTGLTAQSLFFLEESCRVKRSDTQTFSNFSNYFKRVLKLQKRSSSFSK